MRSLAIQVWRRTVDSTLTIQKRCRPHCLPWYRQLGSLQRLLSTDTTIKPTPRPILQVKEFPSASGSSNDDTPCVIYTVDETTNQWKKQVIASSSTTTKKSLLDLQSTNDASKDHWSKKLQHSFHEHFLQHFLPARYPYSVTDGYAKFTLYSVAASVAGSAGMVLSTQTLLLAVGVVGSYDASLSAPIMAGALNWVLKDGIGQLGGVIFASRMGQHKHFDANPKQWRMTAAVALDMASLLEILSPLFVTTGMVLPIACVANVLKNIGFLTASASRAAIHQSFASSGNLADVTAKAGSQSMAAGLVGTALGISLSKLLGQDANNFVLGFCVLSLTHLTCNYLSLKSVALSYLNSHRLDILLTEYMTTGKVLSPKEVAEKEEYLPLVSVERCNDWLLIGSPLEIVCPCGPDDIHQITSAMALDTPYLLNAGQDDNEKIHLTYHVAATGDDLLRGVFHAYLLRQRDNAGSKKDLVSSFQQTQSTFPSFLNALHRQGWNTASEVTSLEPSRAVRWQIEQQ